jgi:hypothetical protein
MQSIDSNKTKLANQWYDECSKKLTNFNELYKIFLLKLLPSILDHQRLLDQVHHDHPTTKTKMQTDATKI